MTATPPSPTPDHALAGLPELTVVDVRAPGEYVSGRLPGAHSIRLDALRRALPALRAGDGALLLVCASGTRAENAWAVLAGRGTPAATLTGGPRGWAGRGHGLHRPQATSRTTWGMEARGRFTAGALVLAGQGLGQLRPVRLLRPAGAAGGLVFSALTDTCATAAPPTKLPHGRLRTADLDATLAKPGSAHS